MYKPTGESNLFKRKTNFSNKKDKSYVSQLPLKRYLSGLSGPSKIMLVPQTKYSIQNLMLLTVNL